MASALLRRARSAAAVLVLAAVSPTVSFLATHRRNLYAGEGCPVSALGAQVTIEGMEAHLNGGKSYMFNNQVGFASGGIATKSKGWMKNHPAGIAEPAEEEWWFGTETDFSTTSGIPICGIFLLQNIDRYLTQTRLWNCNAMPPGDTEFDVAFASSSCTHMGDAVGMTTPRDLMNQAGESDLTNVLHDFQAVDGGEPYEPMFLSYLALPMTGGVVPALKYVVLQILDIGTSESATAANGWTLPVSADAAETSASTLTSPGFQGAIVEVELYAAKPCWYDRMGFNWMCAAQDQTTEAQCIHTIDRTPDKNYHFCEYDSNTGECSEKLDANGQEFRWTCDSAPQEYCTEQNGQVSVVSAWASDGDALKMYDEQAQGFSAQSTQLAPTQIATSDMLECNIGASGGLGCLLYIQLQEEESLCSIWLSTDKGTPRPGDRAEVYTCTAAVGSTSDFTTLCTLSHIVDSDLVPNIFVLDKQDGGPKLCDTGDDPLNIDESTCDTNEKGGWYRLPMPVDSIAQHVVLRFVEDRQGDTSGVLEMFEVEVFTTVKSPPPTPPPPSPPSPFPPPPSPPTPQCWVEAYTFEDNSHTVDCPAVEQCWFTPYDFADDYLVDGCRQIRNDEHGLHPSLACPPYDSLAEAQAVCDQLPDCDAVWWRDNNRACFFDCSGVFQFTKNDVNSNVYIPSVRKDCDTYLGPISMDNNLADCTLTNGVPAKEDVQALCDAEPTCKGILDWNGDGGTWRWCKDMTATGATPPAEVWIRPRQFCTTGRQVTSEGGSNDAYCCSEGCLHCGGLLCNTCDGGDCDDLGLRCCFGQINALPDNERMCNTFTDNACKVPDAAVAPLRCWKTLAAFGDERLLSGCPDVAWVSETYITAGGDLLYEAVQALCDATPNCDGINFRKSGQASLRNCGGDFQTYQYKTATNGVTVGTEYDADEWSVLVRTECPVYSTLETAQATCDTQPTCDALDYGGLGQTVFKQCDGSHAFTTPHTYGTERVYYEAGSNGFDNPVYIPGVGDQGALSTAACQAACDSAVGCNCFSSKDNAWCYLAATCTDAPEPCTSYDGASGCSFRLLTSGTWAASIFSDCQSPSPPPPMPPPPSPPPDPPSPSPPYTELVCYHNCETQYPTQGADRDLCEANCEDEFEPMPPPPSPPKCTCLDDEQGNIVEPTENNPCEVFYLQGVTPWGAGLCNADGTVTPHSSPSPPAPSPPPATPNALVLVSAPVTICGDNESPGDVLYVQTPERDNPLPLYAYTSNTESMICYSSHGDYSGWPSVRWGGPDDSSRRLSEAPVCDPTSWHQYKGPECSVRSGGECAALVYIQDYGARCDRFCAVQGRTCTAAWDDTELNQSNQCSQGAALQDCTYDFGSTSDAICECGPLSDAVCAPELWDGYDDEVCTPRNGGVCAALVLVEDYGGNCDAYCALNGRTCTASWDDTNNNECTQGATLRDCFFEFYSSDTVCELSLIHI